jgi:hypothetical protein
MVGFKEERSSTIPLVVPAAWVSVLNERARKQKTTRSAIIRQALVLLLFGRDQPTESATAGPEAGQPT